MSVPEWRVILESQLSANPQCNTYALATCENGAPRVRYVVHRGLTEHNYLLTCTDLRMQKVTQLSTNNAIEIAWLFQPTMRQFRIRGTAVPHGPNADWRESREDLFDDISPYLRATFARPAPPGSRLSDAPATDTWPVKLGNDQDTQFAEGNFALVVIEPQRVEMLDLKASPHHRVEWVSDGDKWVKEELVP